jgi:hypothetical protein
MTDKENHQQEEESWSRDLVEGYRQAILDYQCQSYLRELEGIDEFVEFLGDEFPHADAIWKRMVYNVKRQEKYEQSKKRKDS